MFCAMFCATLWHIVAQTYISKSGVQWDTLGYKYTFVKVGKWGTSGLHWGTWDTLGSGAHWGTNIHL